jgi:hypothetical protein
MTLQNYRIILEGFNAYMDSYDDDSPFYTETLNPYQKKRQKRRNCGKKDGTERN